MLISTVSSSLFGGEWWGRIHEKLMFEEILLGDKTLRDGRTKTRSTSNHRQSNILYSD